jgi:flagellar basal-body rod protein FlgB
MALLNFYSVASRHAEWASIRRSVIASNIANANTPAYKSQDVEAFSLTKMEPAIDQKVTQPNHLRYPMPGAGFLISAEIAQAGDEYHSGNNVSVDRELIKVGTVSREQNLNAGLMKAFNRLIAMSTRG